MKTIKKLFLVTALLALTAMSEKAQAQVTWTLSQTVNNVDFYYSIQTCGTDTVVFLKFENNNSNSVSITWNEVFETQYGAGQPRWDGLQQQLTLSSGITLQNDCVDVTTPQCLISPFEVSAAYPASVYSFAFAAITVTP